MARKVNVPPHEDPNNGTDDFPFGANVEADGQAERLTVEPPPSREPDDTGDDTNPDPEQLDATNGPPALPDPFDPAALRLSPDTSTSFGIKRALLAVPLRRPGKDVFFRVHPEQERSLATALLDAGRDDGLYLVAPALRSDLTAEPTCAHYQLYTAMDRQGTLYLWPVRLPGPDGRGNPWWDSAHEIAGLARRTWVRVAANQALGAYDVWKATGDLPEPEWPDLPLRDVLRIAFKGRVIDTLDHPVLRKLRGEV